MQTRTYRILNFVSKQPLRLARAFASFLAFIVNHVHTVKTANVTKINLEIALPHLSPTERQKIARQANRNEITSYFEFFNIWGTSNQKNIAQIQHIEGEQFFFDALKAEKGVVLVVPHFGTWEIMNAWFAQHTKMTIMYKPIKDEGADLFVRQARSRENATLVPTDDTGVRQIFRALKQGDTTVILPDHTPHLGGTMVEYFGIPLASSNLASKLIQKTKAKALFLYAIRNEKSGYNMVIQPIDDAIYTCTDTEGTRLIYSMLENLIKKHPEHYHWSYKRFKANPALNKLYNLPIEQSLKKVEEVRQR